MDFAPTATPRVLEKYVSAGVEHVMEFRRPRGEGPATSLTAARATFAAIHTNLSALLPNDFAWLDELYIPQDSDVASGSGWGGPGSIVGSQDPADYTPIMKITATSFSGRSVQSKTRISIFGVFWDPSDVSGPAADGRVLSGENSAIAAVVTALNNTAPTYAIDGTLAAFHPRATVKPNDKLLKLVRRGLIT